MRKATFILPNKNGSCVCVEPCNIVAQSGTKVIHSSRTFDTNELVVRGSSVFGQFLQYCLDHRVDYDEQIDQWCKVIAKRGFVNENLPFRKLVFNEGELCPIKTAQGIVCLAGFCNTTNAFSSESVSLQGYIRYWDNIWPNLAKLTIDKNNVYVTVPGGHLINIENCNFSLEQSIGIILLSYFKYALNYRPLGSLHICISESDADNLDLEGLQKNLMPYLYEFASLPIEISIGSLMTSSKSTPGSSTQVEPLVLLQNDLRDMINAISAFNGQQYDQFEGSKRVTVDVHVETNLLLEIISSLSHHPNLARYFGKAKGNSYDRNAVFQILGTLIERSTCFGNLNRRSIVTLCLTTEDKNRWKDLCDNPDNIVNYVGQRLSKFKSQRESIYQELVSLIPEENRR